MFEPVYGEVYSIQHCVIKFVSDLQKFSGFLRVLGFLPNKTDCHNITEILLKVALNTINLTKPRNICWFNPNFAWMLIWWLDFYFYVDRKSKMINNTRYVMGNFLIILFPETTKSFVGKLEWSIHWMVFYKFDFPFMFISNQRWLPEWKM
jgi:hypothetical protein